MRNTVSEAICNLDVPEPVRENLTKYCEANPDVFKSLTGKEIGSVIKALSVIGTPVMISMQVGQVNGPEIEGPPISITEVVSEATMRLMELRTSVEHGTEALFKHLNPILSEGKKPDAFTRQMGKPARPTSPTVGSIINLLDNIQQTKEEFDFLICTLIQRFNP